MNDIKEVRKQLRRIVKEILPEILTAEQYALIKQHNEAKLNELEKFIKDTLHEMNERHKNTMGYLVRQVSTPVEPKKD